MDIYPAEEVTVRLVKVVSDLHESDIPAAKVPAEHIAGKTGIKLTAQTFCDSQGLQPVSPDRLWDTFRVDRSLAQM